MSKNTGHKRRIGSIRRRSQTYNQLTGKWTKRNRTTGRFIDVKKDGLPFKGVTKEKKSFP